MLETLEATRHLQSTLLPSRRRVLAPPQKRPRLQGRPSISTLPDVGCLPRVRAPPPPNVRCAAAYVPQAPSKPVPSTELEVLDGAAAPASPPCHAAHDHHAHAHAHGHHATATHHQHSPTPTTLRLAAVPLSHTSAAASLPASTAAAAAAPQTHNPLSSTTTAATLSSLDLLTQSLDATSTFETDTEDGEMCTLVQTDHGDVQMVCDSDPTHPISTAEVAALNPIVPATLLQDIEKKLEADLATIGVTILFAVGFITLEFGINDLIEHFWGDTLLSDAVCVFVGLTVVFWIRIKRYRLVRFDRWG